MFSGLKNPVSSIRSAPHNPYITITKSLRSTSIRVGHEFTHIQDSESSAAAERVHYFWPGAAAGAPGSNVCS